MTTILRVLCRQLAAVALLLLAAPASNAADNGAPLPDAGVAKARALFEGGKFEEALAVLRPLAVQAPDRADILFLIGLAAIEYAQRPDTTEAEREERLDEAIASLRAMLTRESRSSPSFGLPGRAADLAVDCALRQLNSVTVVHSGGLDNSLCESKD